MSRAFLAIFILFTHAAVADRLKDEAIAKLEYAAGESLDFDLDLRFTTSQLIDDYREIMRSARDEHQIIQTKTSIFARHFENWSLKVAQHTQGSVRYRADTQHRFGVVTLKALRETAPDPPFAIEQEFLEDLTGELQSMQWRLNEQVQLRESHFRQRTSVLSTAELLASSLAGLTLGEFVVLFHAEAPNFAAVAIAGIGGFSAMLVTLKRLMHEQPPEELKELKLVADFISDSGSICSALLKQRPVIPIRYSPKKNT